jgi:hypothetical protein
MRSTRFITAHRHFASLLGMLLAGVLVASVAAPAALGYGPRLARPPAPQEKARTPHFVTETGPKKWDACAWAAAAMLLEHWTGRPVSRVALRAASRDMKGGASLADVARGAAVLSRLDVRYSPDGGDPMTWSQLLGRLANGGGAEVLGSYSNLPRWYQRWDRKFAASGPKKSAHAVYIERYEPKRGRVWLMDPLGSGDYNGEWISVWALHAFVSERHGLVYAAATPKPIPNVHLATVRFGQPRLTGPVIAGHPATLTVPIERHGKRPPRLAPLRVVTTWTRVDSSEPDGLEVARPTTPTASPTVSPAPINSLGALYSLPATEAPAARPPSIATGGRKGVRLVAVGWALATKVTVPTIPGRYRLTVTFHTDAGKAIGSRSVRPFAPVIVSVGGPYRVRFATPASIPFGGAQTVPVGVANVGAAPWILTVRPTVLRSSGVSVLSGPRVLAEWVYADGSTTTAGNTYLDLKPGASTVVNLSLPKVPSGAIGIRLDLVDPNGGRVSDEGGRPATISVTPIATPLQAPN